MGFKSIEIIIGVPLVWNELLKYRNAMIMLPLSCLTHVLQTPAVSVSCWLFLVCGALWAFVSGSRNWCVFWEIFLVWMKCLFIIYCRYISSFRDSSVQSEVFKKLHYNWINSSPWCIITYRKYDNRCVCVLSCNAYTLILTSINILCKLHDSNINLIFIKNPDWYHWC